MHCCQRLVLLLTLSAAIAGCQQNEGRKPELDLPIEKTASKDQQSEQETTTEPTTAQSEGSKPVDSKDEALLIEVTEQLGLDSNIERWPDGAHLTPEITPGGVALLDFDQDGDLDIYQIRHGKPAEMPGAFQDPAPNRLFRQEPDGTFSEVPEAAGLADPGYGHGCAVGDIDNDGDVDVFVTNYGANRLYQNEGGTFRDITEQAGIEGEHWSSASAFFDYDRDGLLDLFVVHFGVFDPTRRCDAAGKPGTADYCGPHLFQGVTDQLYRNNGNGTFTDITAAAGITTAARGWGVICADLNADGWADIYVCNDEEPNQLWINDKEGGFYDEAMLSGVAVNGFGRVEASMGVTVGDVNADGKFDLFMTHVASETNTLYTLTGEDLYDDETSTAGMGSVDLPYTGWGCGLLDIDHDADLDLAIGNGRVAIGPVLKGADLGPFWNRYAEPNLLFLNDGSGSFSNVSNQSGSFAGVPRMTRGLAFGDLDNDGDIDLVTNSIDNHLNVFRNEAPLPGTHWLQLRLMTGKRDAIGARVRLTTDSGEQVRFMLRAYSYLASNDPRVHFGLGQNQKIKSLEILWPDGEQERFSPTEIDQVVTLNQGLGEPIP